MARNVDPALLILASLCAGAKHGYAIIEDVEAHSGARLGPGTLYGAIARLEKARLIEARAIEERGRRPYRITAAGRRFFSERLAGLQRYQGVLVGLANA